MLKLNKVGLELTKKANGGMETLIFIEEPFDVVESSNTYDIRLKYVGSQISCDIMKNEELAWRNLFTLEELDIHRGNVGFAKKGELNLNILSFAIKDPRESKIKEYIDVQPTLKLINFASMESTCNIYKMPAIDNSKKYDYCHTTMGWCRRSCKNLIN